MKHRRLQLGTLRRNTIAAKMITDFTVAVLFLSEFKNRNVDKSFSGHRFLNPS